MLTSVPTTIASKAVVTAAASGFTLVQKRGRQSLAVGTAKCWHERKKKRPGKLIIVKEWGWGGKEEVLVLKLQKMSWLADECESHRFSPCHLPAFLTSFLSSPYTLKKISTVYHMDTSIFPVSYHNHNGLSYQEFTYK